MPTTYSFEEVISAVPEKQTFSFEQVMASAPTATPTTPNHKKEAGLGFPEVQAGPQIQGEPGSFEVEPPKHGADPRFGYRAPTAFDAAIDKLPLERQREVLASQKKMDSVTLREWMRQNFTSLGRGLSSAATVPHKATAFLDKSLDVFFPDSLKVHKGRDVKDISYYKAGEWIENAINSVLPLEDPRQADDFFATHLPRAVGSSAPLLMSGGAAGPALAMGAALGAVNNYDRVKAETGDENKAITAGWWGAPVGMAAMGSFGNILKGISESPAKGMVFRALNAAIESAKGGGVNFGQAVADNLIAEAVDPKGRDLLAGGKEAFGAGAILALLPQMVRMVADRGPAKPIDSETGQAKGPIPPDNMGEPNAVLSPEVAVVPESSSRGAFEKAGLTGPEYATKAQREAYLQSQNKPGGESVTPDRSSLPPPATESPPDQSKPETTGILDGIDPQRVTGLNLAQIENIRVSANLEGIGPKTVKPWNDTLKKVLADQSYEDALTEAKVALKKDIPPTEEQHVRFVVKAAKLQNEFEQAVRDLAGRIEKGDEAGAREAAQRKDDLRQAIDTLTQASDRAGTQAGRILNIRRMLLNRDTFSLASIIQDATAAKGKKLTAEEEIKYQKLADLHKDLENQLAQLEKTLAEKDAEIKRVRAEQEVERSVATESRRVKNEKAKARIQSERTNILKDLAAMGYTTHTVAGPSPEALKLAGRLAMTYVREGALNLRDVIDKVKERLPDFSDEDIIQSLGIKRVQPKRSAEQEALQIRINNVRKEIKNAVEAQRPSTAKSIANETANTLRAVRATGEISGAFRQGLALTARNAVTEMLHLKLPTKTVGAHLRALKAAFNKYTADQIENARIRDPRYWMLEKMGIDFSENEFFKSRFLDKIPGIREVVGFSDRHMSTLLNLLREDAAYSFLDANKDASPQQMRAVGDMINIASGRGKTLGHGLLADIANWTLFAPRWMMSRFQFLGLPIRAFRESTPVRNEMLKTFLSTVGAVTGVMALAHYGLGADVGLDPRDGKNFGKLSIGGKQFDLWGGLLQPARLVARLGLAGSEAVRDVPKSKRTKILSEIGRYFTYKMSPAVTIPIELQSGKTIMGEETTPKQTMIDALIPITYGDAIKAYQQGGIKDALSVGIPSAVGVGAGLPHDRPSRGRPWWAR